MTPNEYQKEALRTEAPKELYGDAASALRVFTILGLITNPEEDVSVIRLLEGLMGLCGESGEAMDILKKHMFHGHGLDRLHLARELGDIAWYLAQASDAIGYTLEDVMGMNLIKLQERYPDGFDSERSMHRKKGDI